LEADFVEKALQDWLKPKPAHWSSTARQQQRFQLRTQLTERQGPRLPGAKLSKAAATVAVLEKVEKDHGRVETRRYSQSIELGWFADRAKWKGLHSVGMVEATLGKQGTADRGTTLLFVQPAAGGGNFRAGRARPLGDRKQATLDDGRLSW